MRTLLLHRIFFLLPVFWAPISLSGQSQKALISSGELLQEGRNKHDSGKYKAAISLYERISRSDTNYSDALHELSLSHYSDSNYEKSHSYAKLGLKLFPEKAAEWYNLMANALDLLGRKTEAQALYDSSLVKNPNRYLSWFNKGISWYNEKKYTEAGFAFQKCLLIYPYSASAHYFLGLTEYYQGRMARAMLCFAANLLVNPENKYSNNSVNALNGIARVTDEVMKLSDKADKNDEGFGLQQEILLSKIALDTKYKLQCTVDDPITRQLQVVFEKLEYLHDQKDFCMQYYTPFFTKLFAEGKFDLMVNYMFGGLSIKAIQNFNKKNQAAIDGFINYTVKYFNGIRNTRILQADEREQAKTFYLFNNGICTGKGFWTSNGDDVSLTGAWEFYHDNGVIKSKGVFNDKQQKTGEWNFFYTNGILKERSTFVNDTVQGRSMFWFDNGILSEERTLLNDIPDGEEKIYYYNGQLRTIAYYRDGKKNGLQTGYRLNGTKEYEAMQKNGMQDGVTKFFHPNGALSSESGFTEGKAEGIVKGYYDNGVLETESSRLHNKYNGISKSYYPSGKLKETANYLDDELDGESITYYESGQVKEKATYVKGKLDKAADGFDENGIKISSLVYEKGKLKEAHFFDKNGKEFNTLFVKSTSVTIPLYDAQHRKTSEGIFSKDGNREGKTIYYYPTGKISAETEFKNGMQDGKHIAYYQNGVVSERATFREDKIDGYYTRYYEDGKIRSEGWFAEGMKQGPHYEYNRFGKLVNEYYYRNDDLDGYTVSYTPSGKKEYEQLFSESWLIHTTQFDTTGTIISETNLRNGSADMIFVHENGKPYLKNHYEGYFKNGLSQALDFDGVINAVYYYKKGALDSVYHEYYRNGSIKAEGKYRNGEKWGEWKQYYENGQLNTKEYYEKGEEQGEMLMYNEDGTPDKKFNYKDNETDGPCFYYAENGITALVLYFLHGELKSYAYENAEGKLVPQIPLPNGSGKVVAYFRNGKKSAEIDFEGSLVNGVRKLYFSNGNTYIDGKRILNLENGPKKVYYPNGQLLREDTYYYDSRNGLSKQYYPNGKIRAEENIYNDELHGPCRYYDESGNLRETRIYYFNVLKSVSK